VPTSAFGIPDVAALLAWHHLGCPDDVAKFLRESTSESLLENCKGRLESLCQRVREMDKFGIYEECVHPKPKAIDTIMLERAAEPTSYAQFTVPVDFKSFWIGGSYPNTQTTMLIEQAAAGRGGAGGSAGPG